MIKNCKICNKEFKVFPYQLRKGWGIYCSKKCTFSCPIRNKKASNSKKGEKNPMYGKSAWNKGLKFSKEIREKMSKNMKGRIPWNKGKRGKKWIDSKGRVCIFYPEHPNSHWNGTIFEHRLVMSKYVGRALLSNEVVHHIDENQQNNSIENLKLYPSHIEHIKDAHSPR